MSASEEAVKSHEKEDHERDKTPEHKKSLSSDGKDEAYAPDKCPRKTDTEPMNQKRFSELKSPKKAWLAKMTELSDESNKHVCLGSRKSSADDTIEVQVTQQPDAGKPVSESSESAFEQVSQDPDVGGVPDEDLDKNGDTSEITTKPTDGEETGSGDPEEETSLDCTEEESMEMESLPQEVPVVGNSEDGALPDPAQERAEDVVFPMEPGAKETMDIINEVLEEARITKKKTKKSSKSRAKKRLKLDDDEIKNSEQITTDVTETVTMEITTDVTETVTMETSDEESRKNQTNVTKEKLTKFVTAGLEKHLEMVSLLINEEIEKPSKCLKRTSDGNAETLCSTPKKTCMEKTAEAPKDLQIDEEIIKNLEAKADKNNLSVQNVKTILHHVITNEHVLAMVRNTMRDMERKIGDNEPATYEPKMTRSKVKEVTEKGGSLPLPWPISPLKNAASKKPLLFKDLNFSDSDCTSDEDYKPDEDEEREESDYESIASSQTSEFGSPVPPRTPLTPRSMLTDQEADTPTKVTMEKKDVDDDDVEEVKKPEQRDKEDEKVDKVEDVNTNKQERHVKAATVPMGPPPLPPRVVKSPVKDAQTQVQAGDGLLSQEEQDLIAYRTRSKLPLKDTPLDLIEANFVAPDITTDMYDFNCEDNEWKSWLSSLMKEEIDNNDAVDDEQNDPEYNFLSEDEPEDMEDFRNDRAVQITKKEVNELLDELLETYGAGDLDDNNLLDDVQLEDEQPFNVPPALTFEEPLSSILSHQKETAEMQLRVHNERRRRRDVGLLGRSSGVASGQQGVPIMTPGEREQLKQQLQQHIQLLCQVYLLCQGNTSLEKEATQCRVYVNEIDMFAKKNESAMNEMVICNQYPVKSAYSVCNLQDGLQVINMSRCRADVNPNKQRDPKTSLPTISEWAQEIIASKPVFMYHELLPVCGLVKIPSKKAFFTEAEDNLVALGLDQFKGREDWAKMISKLMLPTKTPAQIKIHVKNLSATRTKDNIIKLYKRHQCLPTMPVFIESVPDGCQVPPTCLPGNRKPEWLKMYEKRQEYKRINEEKERKQKNTNQQDGLEGEVRDSQVDSIIKINPVEKIKKTLGRKPNSIYKNAGRIIDPFPRTLSTVIKPILPKGNPPLIHLTRADFRVKSPQKARPRAKRSTTKQSHIVPAPAKPGLTHIPAPFSPLMPGAVATILDVRPSPSSGSGDAVMQSSLLPINAAVMQKPEEVQRNLSPAPAMMMSLPSPAGVAVLPASPITPVIVSPSVPVTGACLASQVSSALPCAAAALSPLSQTTTDAVSAVHVVATSREITSPAPAPVVNLNSPAVVSPETRAACTEKSPEDGAVSEERSTDQCHEVTETVGSNVNSDSPVNTAATVNKEVTQQRSGSGAGADREETVAGGGSHDQLRPDTDKNQSLDDSFDGEKQDFEDLDHNDKSASENEDDANQDEVAMVTNDSDAACECPEDDMADVNDDGILLDKEPVEDNTDSNPCNEDDQASNLKPKIPGSMRSKRMKTKFRKDLESTILLLQPDLVDSDGGEKDNGLAQAFLKRIKTVLGDQPDKYKAVLEALCDFGKNKANISDLFSKLEVILSGWPDLLEDFSCFLTAEQAMECGLFMSHLEFVKAKTFLRELEVFFQKQPNHYQKILKVFKQWGSSETKDYKGLQSSILPLLRGQPHLEQEFMQLIPTARPPESHMTDFEEINWEDKDDYEHDGFEEIELPDSDEEKFNTKTKQQMMMKKGGGKFDPWKLPNMEMHGTRECQCHCHQSSNDLRVQRKARHCVLCNPALQLSRAELAKTVLQARSMNISEGSKKKQAKKMLQQRLADEILEDDTDDQFQTMTETCVNNLSEMCDNLAEILNENSESTHLQHFLSADSEDNSQSSDNDSNSENESSNNSNEVGSILRESQTTILSSGYDRSATNSPIEYNMTGGSEDGEVEQKSSSRIVLKISMNSSGPNTPTMETPESDESAEGVGRSNDKPSQDSCNCIEVDDKTDHDCGTDAGDRTSHDDSCVDTDDSQNIEKETEMAPKHTEDQTLPVDIEHVDDSNQGELCSNIVSGDIDRPESDCQPEDSDNTTVSDSQSSADVLNARNVSKGEDGTVTVAWTREEDRILLQLCQTAGPGSETFAKVQQELRGSKSTWQIQERFNTLMKLFQETST